MIDLKVRDLKALISNGFKSDRVDHLVKSSGKSFSQLTKPELEKMLLFLIKTNSYKKQ